MKRNKYIVRNKIVGEYSDCAKYKVTIANTMI